MLPPEAAALSVNTILPLKVILDANIISAAPINPFIPLNVESLKSTALFSLIIELHPLYPFP